MTTQRWTERQMLDLLRSRYTKVRPGTNADRYVRAEHVPVRVDPDAWWSGTRIADYIAMDTYGSGEIIGHEVKVSRSDWLAELRTPDKADAWRTYCHRWFLVVPDTSIVRDDLPLGWGLMVVGSTGELRVKRSAPVNGDVHPLPIHAMTIVGRSIATTAAREVRHPLR